MTDQSYYDILGVDQDATQEEIKEAFRSRAMECHPDQASDMSQKEAKRKFIHVREAFDVLGDPDKRRTYDWERSTSSVDMRDKDAYEGDWQSFSDNPEVTINSVIEIVARGAEDLAKEAVSVYGGMIKYGLSYGLALAVPWIILIAVMAPDPPPMVPESFNFIMAVVFGIPAGALTGAFYYLFFVHSYHRGW